MSRLHIILLFVWFIFFDRFYIMFEDNEFMLQKMTTLSTDISYLIVAVSVLIQSKNGKWFNFFIQFWVMLAAIIVANTIAGIFDEKIVGTLQVGSTLLIVASFLLINYIRIKRYGFKKTYTELLFDASKFILLNTEKIIDEYSKHKNNG